MKIKIITIEQPWAWCIFHAGKNIENRTWRTKHTGPLYIHTSRRFDFGAYSVLLSVIPNLPQDLEFFKLGAIVGKVHMIGCFANYVSKWAINGHYHWYFADPVEIVPREMRGQLNIFEREVDWL